MQINVTGRHMDVTPAIRTYAEEKVGRVAKIHDRDDMTVEVTLSVEKNPSNKNKAIAEVTAFMKGAIVRAEEAAPDMYAAIDLVSEKLERQMRKYKTRLRDHRKGERVKTAPGDTPLPEDVLPELDMGEVVRTKTIELTPMSADDAILQLELLGHDFYVFEAIETGDVNVLYRRTNGDFGLIVPAE